MPKLPATGPKNFEGKQLPEGRWSVKSRFLSQTWELIAALEAKPVLWYCIKTERWDYAGPGSPKLTGRGWWWSTYTESTVFTLCRKPDTIQYHLWLWGLSGAAEVRPLLSLCMYCRCYWWARVGRARPAWGPSSSPTTLPEIRGVWEPPVSNHTKESVCIHILHSVSCILVV